ncbi:MAG: aminotransferase class I/II-fold pyridoxal phosphate-dependent enzyme [Chloroflexi bacterium]|nr:aminotransferase class I/II-fold pyridoxal phosphate-dependent enzyme [Chloroflexota bacterium]
MPIAHRVSTFGTSIFAEMTLLANQHKAINLSQGFPDFDGPDDVKAAATAAIAAGQNQYALSNGQIDLRQAIAAHAHRFYGQAVNPDTEVTVTSGATEALFAAIIGLVNPGDEVILFEPFYDGYVPDVIMAGGAPRFVPLRAPDWRIDLDELATAFNNRTRAIVVNTPHNPTGKVYSRAELEAIAALCQKWNAVAISDEVYEHIIFDGAQHHRLAQLPGMAERTVTISSQGKTFSFTGWKIGWAIAPLDLTTGIRRAHQFITFAAATPMQAAAAYALGLDDEYYSTLAADYQRRRDYLVEALRRSGLEVGAPSGTYFIMGDISRFGFDDDVAFCRYLTAEIGVAAIPPSAFYSDEHKSLGKAYARFAFCKRMETLERAAERLSRLKR